MSRPKAGRTRKVGARDDARKKLLDAALKSFAEFGFEGTSLRDIARRAGVGFQLISYYFGSKEDLWRAAVQSGYDFYATSFAADRIGDPADLRERLRVVIKGNLREPYLRKILIQEHLAGSQRYASVLLPMINRFYKTVSEPAYQALIDGGAIAPTLAAREAALIVSNITLANLVSAFDIEFFLGMNVGAPELVEREVALLYRQLTPADDTPRDVEEFRAEKRALEALEGENRRLKELVGSLVLRKADANGNPPPSET